MNTQTLITATRPAVVSHPRAATQRLSERRRHFEALFLRSFAGMRARSHAA